MQELGLIIEKKREETKNQQRFAAAIQGVDLSDEQEDVKEKLDEVRRRAEMKISGMSKLQYENKELIELGIEVEEE